MSEEWMIKNMVRSQYRAENDLTAPSCLNAQERKWWNEEATKIEQEEGESV